MGRFALFIARRCWSAGALEGGACVVTVTDSLWADAIKIIGTPMQFAVIQY